MGKRFLHFVIAGVTAISMLSTASCSLIGGAKNGKSAYELAVENGFVGTEAEWLASLKGVDGQDGADGNNGLDGADGQDGADGNNGLDGVDGQDGVDGKSAYELALENGFVGTEEEWLLSLVGKTGVGIEKVELTLTNELIVTMTDGTVHTVTADFCEHSFSYVTTNPTCMEQGYNTYTCEDCGLSYVNDYVPALGHHFVDNACHFCKIDEPFGEIEADTSWYDETAIVYELSTQNQLAGLAYLVNNGNDFSGKIVNLADHIDLESAEWIPIGTNIAPFAGTFDGKYLTIENLKISKQTNFVGLFGYVTGTLKRVNIVNADILVQNIGKSVGIACGETTGIIDGISTSGYVMAANCTNVGGIVGRSVNAVSNCSNVANVTGNSHVGGIAGDIDVSYKSLTFSDLSNFGDICGNNYAGGIFGVLYCDNYAQASQIKLEKVQNSGMVSGGNNVGGIIGWAHGYAKNTSSFSGVVSIQMYEIHNLGNIVGLDSVGGFVGYMDSEEAAVYVYTQSGTVEGSSNFGEFWGKTTRNHLISETAP